jgi:hypothetical protein
MSQAPTVALVAQEAAQVAADAAALAQTPPSAPPVVVPLTGAEKMRADRWAALQAETARLAGK